MKHLEKPIDRVSTHLSRKINVVLSVIKIFIVCLVGIVFLPSCEKENINNKHIQSSDKSDKLDLSDIRISFDNDILIFGDINDYLAMSEKVNRTKNFGQKMKEIFPKFKSSEDAYYEFIESDKLKTLGSINDIYKYSNIVHITKVGDDIFIDPLLFFEKSKLFNENGILQIGDEVFKREYDEVRVLKISHIDNFDNLQVEFVQNKSVKVYPVKLIINGIDNSVKIPEALEQRATNCQNLWCDDPSATCSTHKYRVRGEVIVEISQPGNVLRFGARTKSYKRGLFGAWFSERDGFDLKQSGTVTTTVLIDNSVQTATWNVQAQSSYTGSDHTIENYTGSCCVQQMFSSSWNVNIEGARYKNGFAYSRICNIIP